MSCQALCIFNELLRHPKIFVCTQKHLYLEWPFLIHDTEVILKSKVLNVSQRFANIGWKEHVSGGTSQLKIRGTIVSFSLPLATYITLHRSLQLISWIGTVDNGVCYIFGEEATDSPLFGHGHLLSRNLLLHPTLLHGPRSSLKTLSPPSKVQLLIMAQ